MPRALVRVRVRGPPPAPCGHRDTGTAVLRIEPRCALTRREARGTHPAHSGSPAPGALEREESVQDAIGEVATHSAQEPPSSLEEEASAVVGRLGPGECSGSWRAVPGQTLSWANAPGRSRAAQRGSREREELVVLLISVLSENVQAVCTVFPQLPHP